jgi:hypothetical protein
VLYSTKEPGGRRVLAAYAQVPVPALGLGAKATGGYPAHAAEPQPKVLGRSATAWRRAGGLPRAPPTAVLPPAHLAARKSWADMRRPSDQRPRPVSK